MSQMYVMGGPMKDYCETSMLVDLPIWGNAALMIAAFIGGLYIVVRAFAASSPDRSMREIDMGAVQVVCGAAVMLFGAIPLHNIIYFKTLC